MLVWTEQGMRAKLKKEEELLSTLQLRLFGNDYFPNVDSEFNDFVEVNFGGYAPVILDQWGVPVVVSPGLVQATEVVRIFTWDQVGTPPLAYGCFVVDPITLDLYYAERDPAGPFQFSPAEVSYSVLPRMQVRNMT